MKTHLYIGSTFAVFPNALSQAKNIKSATKPTHQDRNEWITKDKNKARTGNKRYKTLGFRWLCKVSAPHQSLLSGDSDVARNPQRFHTAKR